MQLLGTDQLPDAVAPDLRDTLTKVQDWGSQLGELFSASREQQLFRDQFNSREEATAEAYDRRIAAVREATGIDVANPLDTLDIKPEERSLGRAAIYQAQRRQKTEFRLKLQELQRQFPQHAQVIKAGIGIEQDAEALTRTAVRRADAARANARDVGSADKAIVEIAGALSVFHRDPLQVASLVIGGGEIGAAKTVLGRVASRMFTEAAVNGGVELAVQQRAEAWRKQAGVPIGWDGMWQQVGLAAAFGGGIGGLLQGGSEVLQKLGRFTPDAETALKRINDGVPEADDLRIIADATGTKLDAKDAADFTRAIEDDLDAAAVARSGVDGNDVAKAARAMDSDELLPVERVEDVTVPPEADVPPDVADPHLADSGIKQTPETQLYERFAQRADRERLRKMDDAIALNERDAKHLDAGGAPDQLPSGRSFPKLRAADDVELAQKIKAEIDAKLPRLKAERAGFQPLNRSDASLQVAYARTREDAGIFKTDEFSREFEAQQMQFREQAATALKEAQAREVIPPPQGAKTALDEITAVPVARTVQGEVLSAAHEKLKTQAERINFLADVVASCKVA
jgi:hypothetical protein